jgi:hypothetical protein
VGRWFDVVVSAVSSLLENVRHHILVALSLSKLGENLSDLLPIFRRLFLADGYDDRIHGK